MKDKHGLKQNLTSIVEEYAQRVSEQERAARALIDVGRAFIESCEGKSPEEVAEAYRALPLSLVINAGACEESGEVIVEERPWGSDKRRVEREYGLLLTPAALEGITHETPILKVVDEPDGHGGPRRRSFYTLRLDRIIPLDELHEKGQQKILKRAEYAKRLAKEIQSGELRLEDLRPDERGYYLMALEQPLMGVPSFVGARTRPLPGGDRPHRIRVLSGCGHHYDVGKRGIKEAYRLCGKGSVIELYATGVHVGDLTPSGPRIPDEYLIPVAEYFSEDIGPRDRLSKALESMKW